MDEAAYLKQRVCVGIDEMAPELIRLSHEIHACPELAFEEVKSADLLATAAEAAGLSVTRSAYGQPTAYAAEFGDKRKTKVGVLSEYDALPGIGHACGHNVIAAIGLGTARALHELGEDLPGFVRYLGTPAEESGCGKELMAQAGAFDGLDAAMMLHPAGVNAVAVRTMCISEVLVTFHGRAAHAAVSPATGRNASDAAMISYMSIGQLRQHLTVDEQINGVVTESGSVPNVIPGVAKARYFVRATNAEQLGALKEKIENCFRAGALATGCTADVEWALADYLNMNVNETLANCYESNAAEFGHQFMPFNDLPKGGTDMSNVSHRVPTLHPLIAISPPSVMIHDPEFATWAKGERADKAIVEGSKALAMTAIDLMTKPSLVATMHDEFELTADASQRAVELAYSAGGVHGAGGCGCGGSHQ